MKEKNRFPKGYDKTGEDRFIVQYKHRMTKSIVIKRKPQPKDCPFTREELRLYVEDLPKMVRVYAKRIGIESQVATDFIIHYRDSLPRYKTTTFRGKQKRGQSEIKYMIERLQVRIQGLRSRRMSLIEEVGLLDHEIDDITRQLNSLYINEGGNDGKN